MNATASGRPRKRRLRWTTFEQVEWQGPDWSKKIAVAEGTIWRNSIYQVIRREHKSPQPGFPTMIWLSIKNRDNTAEHDWRDLQRIKNELVGPEHEAVELFPAESRLVDTSNQFHLWCFADPEHKFPFGFFGIRLIANASTALHEAIGSVQRERSEA